MPGKFEAQRRSSNSPEGKEEKERVRGKLQKAIDLLNGESILKQKEIEYETKLLAKSKVNK